MKTIVLLAIVAFITAQAVQGKKPKHENKGEALLAKSPALQEIYDCKPGDKCADNIEKATDKFAEAAEKACPNCSKKVKKHMALFTEAIKNGMSVKKAQKLYNPNNKYFNVVDNSQLTVL